MGPGGLGGGRLGLHIMPLHKLTDQSEGLLGRARADDYMIELRRYHHLWDQTPMEHSRPTSLTAEFPDQSSMAGIRTRGNIRGLTKHGKVWHSYDVQAARRF